MGRTLNIFDFGQAHGVSRQANANGLKVPRNCIDPSNGNLEGYKSSDINREEKQCTYEMKTASVNKKKGGGMPIKTLIAEEISKGTGSKYRTPSVIARLMGLDALPTKEAENHAQQKLPWKQQQQSKSTPDVRDSSQKAKSVERKPNQHVFSTESEQCAFDHPDGERIPQSYPYLNNHDKKHPHKFKKELETWQASKFEDYVMPIQKEKFNMQAIDNQVLKHERPAEGKMALVRQKFMDAKRLATDVNLQQSKEFLEAVEMLQSNKDAFLEFLEQPNSLFAKQLKDLEVTSQSHSQVKQITVLKSSNAIRACRSSKEDSNKERSQKKGEKNEKHSRKLMSQKDLGGRKQSCELQCLPPTRPSAGSIPDLYKQHIAAGSKGKNNSGSLPTRIVVLRPGPGRAQNVQSGSTPSCSPQYQTSIRDSKEIERPRTQDHLQEVHIQLEMGIGKNSKDNSRSILKDGEKQFDNEPKYRREIATEIARHVRESLSRDLMNDAPLEGLTSLTDSSENISMDRAENGYGDVDQEVYTPVSKHSWDSADRFSFASPSISGRSDSSESTVNREARRRLIERWRSTHGNVEEQKRVSSTLGEILALPERKNLMSGSKSPKENEKLAEESEIVLKSRSKNKKPTTLEGLAEWEGSVGQKNGDDNGNGSPKSLQRSRSVPESATTYDRGIEMQCKASIVNGRNAHGIDHARSSSSLSAESIKSKNEKSTKGKFSSMKCNFLMRGKWSNSKKSDSINFVQSNSSCHSQSDRELSVSMQQMAKESQRQERTELSSLVQQEPEAKTETDDFSGGAISETSTISEDGFKQPISDSSVMHPIPVTCQTGLSSVDANCSTGAMSLVLQPEFPSPCSPIKKLPVFEHHVTESITDKGEHPSPVSVLDSPFQEEFSSPKDLKEISSNLHELRLQLHQLKCDNSEKYVHVSENFSHGGTFHFKDHKIGDPDTARQNTCNVLSEAKMPDMSKSTFSSTEKLNFETLEIDDILCPEEHLPDLLYVRSVLMASGFAGDSYTVFARWHSPNYPLDPHLFGKLEDKDIQSETNFSDTEVDRVAASSRINANRSKSERQLLFDCINEVLLEILRPFLNYHPWVRPTKMNVRPMATGKQLLKEMWTQISHHLYPQSEVCCTLESIVTDDLSREAMWMELRGDVQVVGNEIERTIFNDLIEDVLYDLVS